MHVETYEVTETDPETGLAEMTDEALELIEALGLDGQRKLIARREAGDGSHVTTICPYREMDAEEGRVYGELLKTHVCVDKYDRGPIPLRVLQVVALAQREQWFERLDVWCPENAGDKDPLLVGVREDPKHSWMKIHFLLARWGETLVPFDELREKAVARWTERMTAKARKKLAETQVFLASIEAQARAHFAGETVFEP